VGDLGLGPEKCLRATIFCIAGEIALYPEEYYDRGLKVVSVATRRNVSDALEPRVKSLNYLNNIMAKIEGQIAGAPEAILLNQNGYVVECSGDNIFIVRDGRLRTPPSYVGILEGITRQTVIDLARDAGIPIEETLFTRFDVYTADECFLTGTAAELIPVVDVDSRPIGDGLPGAITGKLTEAFRQLTQSTGTPIYPGG
jgi:branched-chain amino acid aminotransferase